MNQLEKMQYIMSAVLSSPAWRNFLATLAGAGACGLALFAAPSNAQTVPTADDKASVISPASANAGATAEDKSIRPFNIEVPEEALVDLRRRIALLERNTQ